LDAAAGKYETCRLAIRDSLLARVEVVSWPAAVVSLPQKHGLSRYLYEHRWVLVGLRTG